MTAVLKEHIYAFIFLQNVYMHFTERKGTIVLHVLFDWSVPDYTCMFL